MNILDYQKIPKDYIINNNQKGLIINHGLGSGKTITAINICEYYSKDEIIVITPASLQNNFIKELNKYNVANITRYKITSYESFHKLIGNIDVLSYYDNIEDIKELTNKEIREIGSKYISNYNENLTKKEILNNIERLLKLKQNNEKNDFFLKNKIVVIDEAHRLHNNKGKISRMILNEVKYAKKILLLTGTPIVNFPNDISPLINLLNNNKSLPEGKKQFDSLFIDESIQKITKPLFKIFSYSFFEQSYYCKKIEIKNKDLFKSKIKGLFSYYKNNLSDNFPSIEILYKGIVMSKLQESIHTKIESDTLTSEDIKKMKGTNENINITNRINCYLNKTRQISNIAKGEIELEKKSLYYQLQISPKLISMIKTISNLSKPALIYSNYLDFGINPIKELLIKHNFKILIFTGETSMQRKKEIIQEYNSGKADILLISSSGGEGLDLKNTRQIHIMEPHWNNSKINQIIGRGVRFKSHVNLPENERNVKIFHWYSKFKKSGVSADEYLIEHSKKKDELNNKFVELIKEVSIEN